MNKGLEALKEIENACFTKIDKWEGFVDVPIYTTKQFAIIEKELKSKEKTDKAFKTIKDICNLKVYKNKLGQCFIEGTHILFSISQEKYELLKEVGL